MTPRLITLNYAATCRGCGTALPADTKAYWAQGAGTACRSCGPAAFTRPRQRRPRPPASTSRPSTRPQPAAPTRAAPAGRPENAPPAPPDQGRWAAYCDYLLACVEAEARESHSTLEGSRGWTALDVNLVTDSHARVPATPDLATQARAGAATLRVGWPVLTRPTEDGTHRLVPLLVVEVDVSADPAPVLVPLTERPTLNPRLADAGLDRSDIALAEELVRTAEDLPAAALAGHLLTMLALDSEDLTGPPHPPTTTGFAQNTVLLEHLEGADFTAGLQRELAALRERTDWPSTAAAAFVRDLPPEPMSEPAKDPTIVLAPVPLNDSQWDAARSAATVAAGPVTVVTGPPGTGKSQVVAAVAATCWHAGRSVLVTSTNNAAVDVAVARLQQIHPVLVLRSGNQEARERLAATAAALASDPAAPAPPARRLADLAASYADVTALRERSTARSRAQLRLLAAHEDLQAVTDGVLLDPNEQPPTAQRTAVRRIARLTRRPTLSWWRRRRLRRHARRVGVNTHAAPDRIHAWAAAWLETADATAALRACGPLASAQVVDTTVAAWQAASVAALHAHADLAVFTGRKTLQRLADTRSRTQALVDADDVRTLRGWATTALSVARTLPLAAGVVDQLVLDEASQCSIAHALPLAYRARRAIVLGDPNQLQPIVTLTATQEAQAARAAGLDVGDLETRRLAFRTASAFDAFARSAGNVHLLDEHYRCHPVIAGWINREFYGGTLTVLTAVDPAARRGIETEPVRGSVERPTGGSWTNPAEADRVCELAADVARDGGSVGIVTPFAAQARLIREKLLAQQGEEWLAAHDVAVATAHRFQGGERDAMIFSTVVTPGMPVASAGWVEANRTLVNVGASRARRLLVLVGDPEAPAAHDLPTLGSLWTAASVPVPDDADTSGLTEPELRFWRAFDDALGRIVPRQRVEGYDVDFAWTAPWGMPVDIEIDDDRAAAPPRSRRRDIERDRVLNTVGWQVVRIPGWYCYAHPDAVIESLRDTLVALQDPTSATVELMPWIGR